MTLDMSNWKVKGLKVKVTCNEKVKIVFRAHLREKKD